MHIDDIQRYILEHYDDINLVNTWGEKSFFINPGQKLKRGTYFATLKEKDSENDKASYLDRNNIYRLNIGINKEYFISMFSTLPARPKKGCIIEGNHNFLGLNTILPHPVYGWMAWICILNPDYNTFNECKKLLDNAYKKSLTITKKKISNG